MKGLHECTRNQPSSTENHLNTLTDKELKQMGIPKDAWKRLHRLAQEGWPSAFAVLLSIIRQQGHGGAHIAVLSYALVDVLEAYTKLNKEYEELLRSTVPYTIKIEE